ncbi:DHA2 family efflux MFS transporter permease subunit [Actinomadura sp. HBU206391]|uniref:DHA2 family efflux MFS transporter permease subunit n=1 Tax=Actinomadura sp. HBU206391 TaxID=2731692 RepID=UPI001650021C|nr:DHA2 family efflux MFS transporter permease subunit [Actinomadura sp. HBU206391]MBC6460713.1 DHA2 family efflux MFS transporter permease subunit [Actinomadura sp. HBU206391]
MRKWHGNQWAVLLTLSLGFFMTLLDLTIVNIAIPSMIEKLDASLDEVLWVVNGYVLILAVLLITAGRLGDLRGPRTMFIAGVAIFTVASLLCGISQNPAELISARVIQGLGAAMLLPQTMTIIIATFPAERRGAALGIWGAVAGVATIAGPTLGGLLVTTLDWRWIFFVNLPIGVLVLVLTVMIVPDTRHERRHRFDIGGVLIATAALFCFVFGLTEGQRYEWNAAIWGLMGAGVVLLLAFVWHQRSRQDQEPLVPFVLFKDRNFTVMTLIGAITSIGMLGFFLPMTIYLQSVLGFSALKAGLVLAPSSVVSMFLAPVAGRMSDRFGGKYILMVGMTLYGLSLVWIVLIADVSTSWVSFLPALVVSGLGIGCVFAPMATEAMRGVEPRLAGAASGVNNTVRQIGSVLGTASVGAVLQNRLAGSLKDEATKQSGQIPAPYRGEFVTGFKNAAKEGLGTGQSSVARHLPPDLPKGAEAQFKQIAGDVFVHGFVTAMRPTVALTIAVVFAGALACFAVKRRATTGGVQTTSPPVEAGLPGQ